MLNRHEVTTNDRNGCIREIFASRSGIATLDLQADCPRRQAHIVTPMPNFTNGDFILELTRKHGRLEAVRALFGTAPEWANVENVEQGLVNSGAQKLI